MMPVTRLSDATFVDLKYIATWLGTETPSGTIDYLVQEKMEKLGLERDTGEDESQDGDEPLVFETTPGLTYTKILSAHINGAEHPKATWASILLDMIRHVQAKGLSRERLVRHLDISAKVGEYLSNGYTFHPDLGISIQGQSAPDAWREVSRLANKHGIPVEVTFQWREKQKAQHPGRVGLIKAGQA